KGEPPVYPSLLGLNDRMSKETALSKIKLGSGRMPSFSGIIKDPDKEEAIIAFLFDIQQARPSQKEADLFEIHSNRLSLSDSEGRKTDTSTVYLNITPFSHFRDIEGRPAIKPPWGALNAINLNTGEYEWVITLGNHPEWQEKGAPETGAEGYGGPIVTAGGLVFIGSTRDKKFRAFDKKTGTLLWETTLPGVANATPCTYWSGGKQYVAVSVSGSEENPSGYIMSFSLPGTSQ
ncbi:MAG: pyrroloquinoline quinone-dependent dehydrogenase, partial [Marivirga sp.]|nr:pyrroloquinoline quinone-dependent dehydrogenase [Marivirga sp.]